MATIALEFLNSDQLQMYCVLAMAETQHGTFDNASTCRYKPSSEDHLMKAFQVLDTDGKGFLTQEQLSKLMMEEGFSCL